MSFVHQKNELKQSPVVSHNSFKFMRRDMPEGGGGESSMDKLQLILSKLLLYTIQQKMDEHSAEHR